MASVKWQSTQCGTMQTTQGIRPATGGFCGKARDNRHKWVKVIEKPTRWRCTACNATQSTNGTRPAVGSFCGRSANYKHKWVKE